MLLSSYERAYRFLCLENNASSKRLINTYLYAISQNLQAYINNDLELKSRVEYFDILNTEIEFFVQSHPINSITSIKHDIEGLYNGNEDSLSNYYIGSKRRSVVLDFPETAGQKALQVTYVGGVSTQATLSTFAIDTTVGTFIVDKYVRGAISGSVGIIKAFTSNVSMQVEVLYGVFKVGEVLNMQNDEGGTNIGSISCNLTSKTVEALCEIYPEITLACEIQMRYNIKTKDDFEVMQIGKDSIMRRPNQHYLANNGTYNDIQPEVRSLLNKHRRYILQ